MFARLKRELMSDGRKCRNARRTSDRQPIVCFGRDRKVYTKLGIFCNNLSRIVTEKEEKERQVERHNFLLRSILFAEETQIEISVLH